ncbi:MAG TPA: hypothetical protein VMV97_01700 [Sulfuriferula sp.]|nr:hypothetical protein [Sulfuriferula sp.]
MRRLAKEWVKPAALGAFLLACALTLAYAESGVQESSRVPKPNVTAEKGEKCVEDTEFMRRNHMKLLLQHRITAVHEGDNQKTDKFSIVNCVNCHASAKDNSVAGPGDFCQSCHAYAAVKITCFECHSSKPSGPAPAFHPVVSQGPVDKASPANMMRYQAYHGRLPNLDAGLNAKDMAGVIQ